MNRVSVSCKSSFQLYMQRSTASIVKRHVSSIVPAIFSPPKDVAGQIHDSSPDYQFIQTTRPSSLSDIDRLSMYRVQHPHLSCPTDIPLSSIVDASNCTVSTTNNPWLSQLLHARPNRCNTSHSLPRLHTLPSTFNGHRSRASASNASLLMLHTATPQSHHYHPFLPVFHRPSPKFQLTHSTRSNLLEPFQHPTFPH
jgi:hypothetical protein